jgi:hypothetical protein
VTVIVLETRGEIDKLTEPLSELERVFVVVSRTVLVCLGLEEAIETVKRDDGLYREVVDPLAHIVEV